MKGKALLAAFGLLFLIIPIAAAKGKPAGANLSVACFSLVPGPHPGADGDTDWCDVVAQRLVPGKAYQIEIVNNCTAEPQYIDFTADASGSYSNSLVSPPDPDASNCGRLHWTFYLFTLGSNGHQLQLVAHASAIDNEV